MTADGYVELSPVWTPDGMRITFQFSRSERSPGAQVVWQLADGSGGFETLGGLPSGNPRPHSWFPDGQLLAVVSGSTPGNVWLLRRGEGEAQPLLRSPFAHWQPMFSPDGRWLAYASNESGRFEIYVQAFPGPAGKWQISTEGGTEPVWSPDGRELFYRSGSRMMGVDITAQPSFAASRPRMLFEGQYERSQNPETNNYDISPDAQRFLMVKPGPADEAAPTQINIVLNWFEELKRRVPGGN